MKLFTETYFDAALAAAEAEAAFASFLVCLVCFAAFSPVCMTGLASATGVAAEALADAGAATTLAAGADLATLAAAAAVAGLAAVLAEADALAGVCANALPITTVEAMMAVISLFMIFPSLCLGCLLGLYFVLRFVVTLRKPKTPPGYIALTQKTTEHGA